MLDHVSGGPVVEPRVELVDDALEADDCEQPGGEAHDPGQREDHEHDEGLGPGGVQQPLAGAAAAAEDAQHLWNRQHARGFLIESGRGGGLDGVGVGVGVGQVRHRLLCFFDRMATKKKEGRKETERRRERENENALLAVFPLFRPNQASRPLLLLNCYHIRKKNQKLAIYCNFSGIKT